MCKREVSHWYSIIFCSHWCLTNYGHCSVEGHIPCLQANILKSVSFDFSLNFQAVFSQVIIYYFTNNKWQNAMGYVVVTFILKKWCRLVVNDGEGTVSERTPLFQSFSLPETKTSLKNFGGGKTILIGILDFSLVCDSSIHSVMKSHFVSFSLFLWDLRWLTNSMKRSVFQKLSLIKHPVTVMIHIIVEKGEFILRNLYSVTRI